MSLVIIRHGETSGNASGIVQFPDVPLNEHGIRQAQRVGKRFAANPPRRVLASDYRRTRMTAEHICQATGAELTLEPLLRERHFGDLRGQSHAAIGNLYAADLEPPNGESWPMFHARIDRAWDVIVDQLASTPGYLIVVTHGLVCYSLAARHLQLPAGQTAAMNFRNTSVTEVVPHAPWQVTRLNCIAHLSGAHGETAIAGGV